MRCGEHEAGSSGPSRRAVCLMASVAVLLAGGCHGSPAAVDAGLDAALPDARPDAAQVWHDARPRPDALVPWDSGPPIDAVPGSVIRLPPSGQTLVTNVWHYGTKVVYSDWRGADEDVYLYDLMTLQEATVVAEQGTQTFPYIWGDTVMWSDDRWYSEPDHEEVEIFAYDIPTAQIRQITNDGFPKTMERFNTRFVLYDTQEGVPPGESGSNLMLLDRQTEEATVLASYETWWEGADMSETHVSWVAHSPWETGLKKSVFVYDLATGTSELLMSTVPSATLSTSTSGDWVTWEDNRNGSWDIYAYRISTGQEICLVDEAHDQRNAFTRQDLVVWADGRWSPQSGDLVIYDLQTGFWRRVTGWSDSWYAAPAQDGWLVYKRGTGWYNAEVYAMDLVANLILEPSGRVIP